MHYASGPGNCKLGSGDAEDTPQTAAEVEAVLRSVEIVTDYVIQSACLGQNVQVAGWADAALRADFEREWIHAQYCRVLDPRLEVPVMAEECKPVLSGMTRRLEDSETNTGSRLRGEQRSRRIARRGATPGVGRQRAERVRVVLIAQRSKIRFRRQPETRPYRLRLVVERLLARVFAVVIGAI